MRIGEILIQKLSVLERKRPLPSTDTHVIMAIAGSISPPLRFGRGGFIPCPNFRNEGGLTTSPCKDYSRVRCRRPCEAQVIFEQSENHMRQMANDVLPPR